MARWQSLVGVLATGALLCLPGSAQAATTLVVGPGHPYAKPCQAIAAAQPGDTVQIDAAGNGTYDGDVCGSSVANLTIEGINGRAHIDAAGQSYAGKGTWVLSGAGALVRNVELSGAANPDQNGAGIRVDGSGDLTLVASYIHGNEDGILVGGNATDTDVTVDSSEFAANGNSGGIAHNIYVATAHSFTMRYSYSHSAIAGNLVRSGAATNNILYNRLTGEGGTARYELDLPKGGLSNVIGNVIQQGDSTTNGTMLSYGDETPSNPSQQLYVVNNTFVNDRMAGGTAVHLAAGASPASVVNNIKVGPGTFVDQAGASLVSNCQPAGAGFTGRASFDYHLGASSPCRDAGTPTEPGPTATEQYVYDEGHEPRTTFGSAPDAGAFEYAPDSDGDGIADPADACPSQSDAAAPRSPRTGCPADGAPPPPADADGDGIPDASDACPSVSDAAAPRSPRTGCPADAGSGRPGATAGNDVLNGDAGANVLCGLGGSDVLNGMAGNDTLFGDECGVKNRTVTGAAASGGNDKLNGGSGNDKLYGAAGNDTLNGGAGNDKLFGGRGNDKLAGGAGKNTYSGGAGNDNVNARNGKKETVDCGSGKKDKATVDKRDKVKHCEKVRRARK
jgi:Ca2+-binding RTX toxin-like protein